MSVTSGVEPGDYTHMEVGWSKFRDGELVSKADDEDRERKALCRR